MSQPQAHVLNTVELLNQGLFLQRSTSTGRILTLIENLRPRATLTELIRIGGNSDGGYLVPADLTGVASCFSPGVGLTASFETDLQHRFNIPSHLADGSVSGPPPGLNPRSFTHKFVGPLDDESHITLATWVEHQPEYAAGEDLALQMDIEGAEYTVILATPREHLRRFRWMVIEFHGVIHWCDAAFFNVVEETFRKVLQDFVVVHNHPNNCCGLLNLAGIPAPSVFELTFHRRDRCRDIGPQLHLPHSLDRPNVPGVPDLQLPDLWFRPMVQPPGR
jgi:hypothetical protein